MKLNESQITKIDPLLEEVLMRAKGDEVIRAIMSLGDENQLNSNASNPPLEPQQFTSSEAYRQALIDRRKSQLTEVLGDTIQALQQLSLKTLGGGLSRVVVVEGSADAILRSLALSGVNHVTLDQLIALPEVAPDAAVKHFADIYINTLNRPLDKKTTKLIYQASEQYIINYHKRHNKLQILGMQQPVDLDSIFTPVQCLQPDDIRPFESIEALQNHFSKAGKRGFLVEKAGKQEGIKVANQQQYLMVLGAPGAGKSTFLRKIGLEALKGKSGELQYECIPVFIELKLFTESNINIEEVIREAFRLCQLPFSEEFTNKALQQGKLLILLDGLDEVSTGNTDLAIRKIQTFVEQYKENRFIISCRTAAYKSQFRNLIEIAIADFDDAQIQQFIQNWFTSEVDRQAGTADKCWNLIKNQESTKELAKTPLLLTFLCLVYDASQDLPKNRATLYSKALDILLEKWAAGKRIQTDPIYRQLGIDLERIMLAEIAYHSFKSQQLFLSHQELVSQIKEFLHNNDNAPKDLDAEAVLDAIAIQQGILVERARNIYSFSHLTLQEYLTAQYVDDHRQIEKLVTEHLIDEHWKNVFLLVAGLIRGGADDLMLLMEKEAQKYINTPKLQALLNWAEQVTVGSTGDFKPMGKRAVAIANAYTNTITANAYTYGIIANGTAYSIAANTNFNFSVIFSILLSDLTYAIAIVNANADAITHARNYTRELEKLKIFNKVNFTTLIAQLEALEAQVPNDEQSWELRWTFAKHLRQTLLNAFNLTSEMVKLSKEEIKALENYLYANYLIIQCKQAAVRVSPQTWEAIEARMLLAPGG
ncbi:NACHT C-terminal helical domain 2-containing protein [Nostoc sp. ChiVER01]|uniref:NACHT C-terminal helical domain 2-containing protein n=1 Tax=Nostoc sp. ChiVER01 TaxID=3075382 RepID=UPI002AD3FD4C|nr:NACHT domain-containing protein [Nostoc sp. ChiVER01]MDZ8221879.1 NACHT domain-containing protein [Nostoc sp. ChiVER01]